MKRLAILALLLVSACKITVGNIPCGSDAQCAPNEVCGTDGTCQPAPACADGQRLCADECVSISTTTNCGTCGNVCSSGLSCISGSCATPLGTAVITAPQYADQGAASVAATVTSGDPTATYAWTISGGTFVDGTDAAVGPLIHFNAGTGAVVMLTAVGTNSAGDTETGHASVTLVAPLPATIPISTAAAVTAGQANIPASVTAITGVKFAWSIVNGTLATSAGTSVTYTAGSGGGVTLSVVATSLSGSTANGQVIVQIDPAPGALSITTVATAGVGQTGIAASVPAQDGVTLTWKITGGTFADNTSTATGPNVTYTAGLGPSVVLTVTGTNAAGASQMGTATVPVTIGAPQNVSATASGNQISLRWDGVAGATEYHVLRASAASDPPMELADVMTTNAVDASLANGKRYYYEIEASTGLVDGAPSTKVNALTALPAPTNLAAANGTPIVLTWDAVPDATSYEVFRSSGEGAPASIGTPSTNSYSDAADLEEGQTYSYTVRAVTPDAESADSNVANGVSALDAPMGLMAAVDVYDVMLTWTANEAATSFDVLRSTSAASGFAPIATVNTESYCDCAANSSSSPQPATVYYYQVRANTSAAQSPVSSVVSAATQFPPPANIAAAIADRNTVVLTWTAVANATGYLVLRSASATGTFAQIGQTTTESTYTDSGLAYGTTFYYELETLSAAGTGPASRPPVPATTSPSP